MVAWPSPTSYCFGFSAVPIHVQQPEPDSLKDSMKILHCLKVSVVAMRSTRFDFILPKYHSSHVCKSCTKMFSSNRPHWHHRCEPGTRETPRSVEPSVQGQEMLHLRALSDALYTATLCAHSKLSWSDPRDTDGKRLASFITSFSVEAILSSIASIRSPRSVNAMLSSSRRLEIIWMPCL